MRSLDTLASWRDEFLVAATPRDPDSFPFIVLGNKVDVTDKAREVPTRRAKTWCMSQGCLPLFETSAMDDVNVEGAFDVVVRKALVRLNAEPQDLYASSCFTLAIIVLAECDLTFVCSFAVNVVFHIAFYRIMGDTVEIDRHGKAEDSCAC